MMGSRRPDAAGSSDKFASPFTSQAAQDGVRDTDSDGPSPRHTSAPGSREDGSPARTLSVRAVLAGLLVGSILTFSNTYFGLQTGWVTMGSLQSAIMGFGLFKSLQRYQLFQGFTMEENVILQTTAVATATMPLAAGMVGVVPAMTLLTTSENPGGPIFFSAGQLALWSLALAFSGVFCAVPLRTQTILKEKLRFPSGTATANVIKTLHMAPRPASYAQPDLRTPRAASVRRSALQPVQEQDVADGEQSDMDDRDLESQPLVAAEPQLRMASCLSLAKSDSIVRCASLESKLRSLQIAGPSGAAVEPSKPDTTAEWQTAWRALLITGAAAGAYTVLSAEVPWLRSFPILSWVGWRAATEWGWVLSPALGYVGQGMIMGPRTAVSMLAGALAGWACLGPFAHAQGWAPGAVSDWQTGASGWILWVSLAIMLGDSLTSLSLLCANSLRSAISHRRDAKSLLAAPEEPYCKPIPTSWWVGGLAAAAVLATAILCPMMDMPAYEPLAAVVLTLLVAVLAVRALGMSDLNPVSGVGKLSQVIFAVVAPGRVVANLVAGAVAEAGAQQAGDMMQDFKAAHLLGVCPREQFWAMLIGSGASIFVSVAAYQLYTLAWPLFGPELPCPTARVWLDMAQLVNGGKLPPHVVPFCAVGAVLAALLPVASELLQRSLAARGSAVAEGRGEDGLPMRTSRLSRSSQEHEAGGSSSRDGINLSLKAMLWVLPNGIGFAVGMYIPPRFTIPRVIGAFVEQSWLKLRPQSHGNLMVIVASGLVLGEGTASILVALVNAVF